MKDFKDKLAFVFVWQLRYYLATVFNAVTRR